MIVGFTHDRPEVGPSYNATFSRAHGDLLDWASAKFKFEVVIEVGAGIGVITEYLARLSTLVYAVDAWEEKHGPDERTEQTNPHSFDTFCVNCWDERLKIIPVVGQSHIVMDWIHKKRVKVDAIYLDGSHTYHDLCRDFQIIRTCFPDAIILGDDFTWECNGDRPIHRFIMLAEASGMQSHIFTGGTWCLENLK